MNRMSEQGRGEAWRGVASAPVCPACGAQARRAGANFCSTCGRGLHERAYAPADALLASYHLQYSRPPMLIERWMRGGAESAPSSRRAGVPRLITPGSALVIVVLTFVPFLGILFCPCAVVLGAVTLRRAHLGRVAQGEMRVAAFSLACGVLVFGVQSFLWWVLYLLTK